MALNGINNVANRPDLLDRAILIELCRIDESNRRELSELMADFEKDLPCILGGVFDVLSKAMSLYPTVKLDILPRMADFARWGYAIGEALGGLGNEFLEQYNDNHTKRNIEVLNSNITATLIIAFMSDKAEWRNRFSDLYNHLLEIAPQCGISQKTLGFPGAPNVLSRRLNEIRSNLKEAGIVFETKDEGDGNYIRITNEKISPVSSTNHYLIDAKEIIGTDKSPIAELDTSEDEAIVF